jgi:L,D-transpeptidase catalytic domain
VFAQPVDLGRRVRGAQLAGDPGLDAVHAGDREAGHGRQPAEAQHGVCVAAGDDGHPRAVTGERGQRLDRTVDRAGVLRVTREAREGAVEVGRDQGSPQQRPERGHQFVGIHGPILADDHDAQGSGRQIAYAEPVRFRAAVGAPLALVAVVLTACSPDGSGPAAHPTVARRTATQVATSAAVPAAVAPAVATPTVGPPPTPNPCAANAAAQLVKVSVRRQHLWMCAGHRLVRDTAVTTGIPGEDTHTPTGSYTVQARTRNTTLTLISGRTYAVKYWIPFQGPLFGFHDSSWQDIPYGSPLYRTQGSHGCVHMPLSAIAFLYRWVHVGATVRIRA